MWPGEYPPEGHRRPERRSADSPGFNVAGGVSPGRSPSMPTTSWTGTSSFNVAGGVSPGRSTRWASSPRTNTGLQCGRGSIPRKVAAPRLYPHRLRGLQCGRGSIPRKVLRPQVLRLDDRLRFNVAGGVSPGRSPSSAGGRGARLSSFNVAGGVSPGRSSRLLSSQRFAKSLQCGRGSIPRKVAWGRSLPVLCGVVASMWPGEYPPEGRCGTWNDPCAGECGFNVAGGVSPGRSSTSTTTRSLTSGLQCGRGSIPRKVGACRRAARCQQGASMWPGEYPPEGLSVCNRLTALYRPGRLRALGRSNHVPTTQPPISGS